MKGVILTLLLNSVILLGAINVMSTKFKRLSSNTERLAIENKTLSSKLDTIHGTQDENYKNLWIKLDDIETKQDFSIKSFECLTDNLLDNAYEMKEEIEENKKAHLQTRETVKENTKRQLEYLHTQLLNNPPKFYVINGGAENVLKNK